MTAQSTAWPAFAPLPATLPTTPAVLALPGSRVKLSPGEPGAIWQHRFAMPVSQRDLHAFDWLARQPDLDPAWVAVLWQGWIDRHAEPDDGDPAWSGEVAAARAVNLLDYARRVGLSGGRSLAVLAAHAPALAARIERGGSTGAALTRQGWGLYRLGAELRLEAAAQSGLAILLAEARRLIRPSGLLDTDSTGAHLGHTRIYADAWLAARRLRPADAGRLEIVLKPMLAALSALTLPGGLPQVGAVAAEVPRLAGLLPGRPPTSGWAGLLPPDEQACLAALRDDQHLDDLERIAADGWLRFDSGRWHGLWHRAPDGWCRADAGGHHDLGGFELHLDSRPIFVDPGSAPPDGDPELVQIYRSAVAHNGLTLDGRNPYPPARRSYSEAFRRAVTGAPPVLRAEYDGVSLYYDGFARLGGPRHAERRWRFAGTDLAIDDLVLGTGRFLVERRLITPLPAHLEGDKVILSCGERRLAVTGNGMPQLHPASRWTADGTEQPLTMILFAQRVILPWRGGLGIALID